MHEAPPLSGNVLKGHARPKHGEESSFSELFENGHYRGRGSRGREVSKKAPLASRLAGIEDKKQNS